MAKPKAHLPAADHIRAAADSEGRLELRVTPGAKVEAMELSGGVLHIKIRAKPQDGEANEAVLKLLAKALSVAPSRLTLLRGATGRNKQVQIPA